MKRKSLSGHSHRSELVLDRQHPFRLARKQGFGFCLTKNTLYIMEDSGDFKALASHCLKHQFALERPSQLLLGILEWLTENDVPYMSHIETELERMEDELSGSISDDFFRRLTRHRQKLSELGSYYGQLSDIGERLSDEVCRPIVHDTAAWEKFARRVERLGDHASLVSESALQLQECNLHHRP